MQTKSDKHRVYLLADISEAQKAKAKNTAKKHGMTLQGWVAQLIVRELDHESYPQTGETAKG